MLEHVKAAEGALRQCARRAGELTKPSWHTRQSSCPRSSAISIPPLSECAVARRELVDALLDGTDALRLQADAERQAVSKSRRADREAKADELERSADAILELDRDLI